MHTSRKVLHVYLHETERRRIDAVAQRTNVVRIHRHRPLQALELPEAHGHHPGSAVLLPVAPGGEPLGGLLVVAAALGHLADAPERRLLVAAHSPSDADGELTALRAGAALACLLGDRAAWSAACQARHVPRDTPLLLRWVASTRGWECDPGTSAASAGAALDRFRACHGGAGPVGAELGPADWEALLDCYDLELARLLELDAEGLAALRGRVRVVGREAPPAEPALRPAPDPTPPRTVRRGDGGAEVRRLQSRLVELGAELEVDGAFGPATERAVSAFQRQRGLSADGVVGPQTWGALLEATPTPEARRAEAFAGAGCAVGCGASWPRDRIRIADLDATADGRLDFLTFAEKDVPALDCHAGPACEWKRCDLYRKARYRAEPLAPLPQTPASGRRRLTVVEFEDALFRLESAVLLPEAQEPGDAPDETPGAGGVGLVATCLRALQERSYCTLLVAGHTDTSGSEGYNLRLSEHRAACVHAAIVGDRAAFAEAAHGPHLTPAKRSVLYPDQQQVLRWVAAELGWPCDPAQHETLSHAVLSFQQSYNREGKAGNTTAADLQLTAVFDRPTWGALFDCYELALRGELGLDAPGLAALRARVTPAVPDHPRVGCGEHHPIEALGRDDYRSQTNRRVEALLFDPGEAPALPCHAGPCDPAACDLYTPEAYDREHLPPMISARPWQASWQEPDLPAGVGQPPRGMRLEAPGLPAGVPLAFALVQEVDGAPGPARPVAQVVSREGQASATVEEWFDEASVPAPVALSAGARFPGVAFRFVVTGGGRQVTSPPLPYSDAVKLRFEFQDDGAPIRDTPFTLLTPWGTLEGVTDADGRVEVEGLPPGGADVILDEAVLAERAAEGAPE